MRFLPVFERQNRWFVTEGFLRNLVVLEVGVTEQCGFEVLVGAETVSAEHFGGAAIELFLRPLQSRRSLRLVHSVGLRIVRRDKRR